MMWIFMICQHGGNQKLHSCGYHHHLGCYSLHRVCHLDCVGLATNCLDILSIIHYIIDYWKVVIFPSSNFYSEEQQI